MVQSAVVNSTNEGRQVQLHYLPLVML